MQLFDAVWPGVHPPLKKEVWKKFLFKKKSGVKEDGLTTLVNKHALHLSDGHLAPFAHQTYICNTTLCWCSIRFNVNLGFIQHETRYAYSNKPVIRLDLTMVMNDGVVR